MVQGLTLWGRYRRPHLHHGIPVAGLGLQVAIVLLGRLQALCQPNPSQKRRAV